MAKIGRAVAGSTEPVYVTLKVNGVAFPLTGYTVSAIVLTLEDGTVIDVTGVTVAAVADQVTVGQYTGPGKVKITPTSGLWVHSPGTLHTEPTKYLTRIKVLDGASVPMYFPDEEHDWIAVWAA